MTLSQLTCGPQQRSASRADMANCCLQLATVEAVVSFYALIHVPLADQRALFPRIRAWLRPGGYFLAIVGAQRWTGIVPYLGAGMFWEHAGTASYLCWAASGAAQAPWHRHVPEGDSGHSLILAKAP